MDIILIQTEICIKMICLWRSPPDRVGEGKEFQEKGGKKEKKERKRGKINFLS